MAASRSAGRIGLVWKSSMPAARQRSRSALQLNSCGTLFVVTAFRRFSAENRLKAVTTNQANGSLAAKPSRSARPRLAAKPADLQIGHLEGASPSHVALAKPAGPVDPEHP